MEPRPGSQPTVNAARKWSGKSKFTWKSEKKKNWQDTLPNFPAAAKTQKKWQPKHRHRHRQSKNQKGRNWRKNCVISERNWLKTQKTCRVICFLRKLAKLEQLSRVSFHLYTFVMSAGCSEVNFCLQVDCFQPKTKRLGKVSSQMGWVSETSSLFQLSI